MTHKEKRDHIVMHPEYHRHAYNDLVACCMEDGVLNTELLQCHEGAFGSNGGVKCDVMEGPCACGGWHGGNN